MISSLKNFDTEILKFIGKGKNIEKGKFILRNHYCNIFRINKRKCWFIKCTNIFTSDIPTGKSWSFLEVKNYKKKMEVFIQSFNILNKRKQTRKQYIKRIEDLTKNLSNKSNKKLESIKNDK